MKFSVLAAIVYTLACTEALPIDPSVGEEASKEVLYYSSNEPKGDSLMAGLMDSIASILATPEKPTKPKNPWKKIGKHEGKKWKHYGKHQKKKWTPKKPAKDPEDPEDPEESEEESEDDEDDEELEELEEDEEKNPKKYWKHYGKDQKKYWKHFGKDQKKKYTPKKPSEFVLKVAGPPVAPNCTATPDPKACWDDYEKKQKKYWKDYGKKQKKYWKHYGKHQKKHWKKKKGDDDKEEEEFEYETLI